MFIASKINISSWRNLLYADHARSDSIFVFFVNWMSIVLIGLVIGTLARLKKRKTYKTSENMTHEDE